MFKIILFAAEFLLRKCFCNESILLQQIPFLRRQKENKNDKKDKEFRALNTNCESRMIELQKPISKIWNFNSELKKRKEEKANHDYYSDDNYGKFNTDKNNDWHEKGLKMKTVTKVKIMGRV